MTGTVLILGGSGNIGWHSIAAFTHAGWRVRRYDRKIGNLSEAAIGADVIVNGLNPPQYRNWDTEIPRITGQVIEAARASGASIIVPGNVYNFANRDGVFDEHTPHDAITRKGVIRIAMERQYRRAVQHGVRTIILRAGSFIDPHGDQDVMGLIHMRGIKSHKLTQIGGADTRHAYCYLPDWARAAVALSSLRDQLQPFEDIPFPGHDFTINELKRALEQSTGQSFTIDKFPWAILWWLSPFWKLAYEMQEMRGLWETSHRLGGDKFRRLLPQFQATDLDEVMRCSLPESMRSGVLAIG